MSHTPVLSWWPPHNLLHGSRNRRVVSLRGALRHVGEPESQVMQSTFRSLMTSTLAIGLGVVCLRAQAPDQPRATFRSAADLVSIQASVRDKHGRPLEGLKASDFEVRDNGQPSSILSLR